MKKILTYFTFLFFSLVLHAQDNAYDQDILKMLSINGSSQSYNLIFDQIVLQLKSTLPELSDEVWIKIKYEVFDNEIKELENQMISLYKKYLSHEDVKAIIAFYKTEAGKNLAAKTPKITQESVIIGQQWSMNLGFAIQDYMQKNGYTEQKSLIGE
jgi:hypothetical protein